MFSFRADRARSHGFLSIGYPISRKISVIGSLFSGAGFVTGVTEQAAHRPGKRETTARSVFLLYWGQQRTEGKAAPVHRPFRYGGGIKIYRTRLVLS